MHEFRRPETMTTAAPEPRKESSFEDRLIKQGLISSSWFGRVAYPNGRDLKITVGDVWQLYQRDHLPTVSESTRVMKTFRCAKFFPPLFQIKMCEMTPQLLSEFVRFKLEKAKIKVEPRRWNFEKELRDLKSLLNWYKDTIDFQYANPVKIHHYKLAVLREIPRREREIRVDQFQLFLSHLSEFYSQLCTLQYLGACRIGEAAGLQWKNVDFEKRIVRIQEILVWIEGRPKIKLTPKNSKTRFVYMSDAMFAILQNRLLKRDGCDFVFHRQGKPLLYSVINANYNRAWKKSGLTQFHSTHQTRYFSAQRARVVSGSIDGVKAVTGQGLQMAQKYSDYSCIEQNKSTIEKMEIALLGTKEVA